MRWRLATLMLLSASTAHATDAPASITGPGAAPAAVAGPAEPEPEPEPERRHSSFTLAFAGGALVPRGAMESQHQPGLDVWGRVGWTTPSGLGLVMHLEYAPLRAGAETSQPRDEVIDAHLFAATAGPRLTIGRDVIRVWLAGSAGVVIERIATTRQGGQPDLSSSVQVDSALGVSGGGGVDLCFFGSGGVTVAGAYTRGLSSGATQDYVSVNAGLVFVY